LQDMFQSSCYVPEKLDFIFYVLGSANLQHYFLLIGMYLESKSAAWLASPVLIMKDWRMNSCF